MWAIRDDETNALFSHKMEGDQPVCWGKGYDRTILFETKAAAEDHIECDYLVGVTVVKLGLMVLDEGHSVEGFPDDLRSEKDWQYE